MNTRITLDSAHSYRKWEGQGVFYASRNNEAFYPVLAIGEERGDHVVVYLDEHGRRQHTYYQTSKSCGRDLLYVGDDSTTRSLFSWDERTGTVG